MWRKIKYLLTILITIFNNFTNHFHWPIIIVLLIVIMPWDFESVMSIMRCKFQFGWRINNVEILYELSEQTSSWNNTPLISKYWLSMAKYQLWLSRIPISNQVLRIILLHFVFHWEWNITPSGRIWYTETCTQTPLHHVYGNCNAELDNYITL